MNKVTLSGMVLFKYEGSFEHLKLVQEDGYEVDVILRFQEAVMNYPNHMVKVDYGVTDKPCTESKLKEEFLRHVFGDPKAGYEQNEYRYSSWTWGTDYDTNFKVGGHDMMMELRSHQGKFLLLNMEFEKKVKRK